MDQPTFVATVDRAGRALVAAARDAGLDAPVPSCPDWDVRRLLQHTAKVHQRTEAVVRTGADTPPRSSEFPRFSDDDALFDEFLAVLDRLVTTLGDADPAGPSWNFTGAHQQNDFWFRRMAHETTIHRVDAELAAGAPVSPVEAALAVDGIDELVVAMMPNVFPHTGSDLQATVHLHSTDQPGEWLVTFGGGRMVTTREHAKGDLAVRGPAEGIYLWAWDRRPVDDAGLEVFGDEALVAAFTALVP
jgi:uncharacterized protein (TIGR03083 family)